MLKNPRGILNLNSRARKLALRGGTRIPCDIPAILTSLDPQEPFSQSCQVILANLGGCALRSPRALKAGTEVRLSGLPANAEVDARVVTCISLGEFEKLWILGLALAESGNIWGLESVPEDWILQE